MAIAPFLFGVIVGDTTNTQILNAINRFQGIIAGLTQAIDGLTSEVQGLRIDVAKLQTWRNGHESVHESEKDRLDKLESRTTLQGVIIGIGEVIIGAVAFFGGKN